MARREQYGDREALERELVIDELRAIVEICRACSPPVPRDEWHRCESIARPFELLAHERLTRRLMDEGRSRHAAELRAAIRLGLSEKTLQARRRRWGTDAA